MNRSVAARQEQAVIDAIIVANPTAAKISQCLLIYSAFTFASRFFFLFSVLLGSEGQALISFLHSFMPFMPFSSAIKVAAAHASLVLGKQRCAVCALDEIQRVVLRQKIKRHLWIP